MSQLIGTLVGIQLNLLQAAFDMSPAATDSAPKQTGKTLMIVKVLTKFTTNLKAHLKNHPESAAALDMVLDHIKTVSPGQISALDWNKAFALFQQTTDLKLQQEALATKASKLPGGKPLAKKPGAPAPAGQKPKSPKSNAALEPTYDVEVATATILGLKKCAEFLQSGDSLTLMFPMGDKAEGMGHDPEENVQNTSPTKVPNAIVEARCKAINTDSSPVRMAAEAIFAMGLVCAGEEATEANPDFDLNALDMILHMGELVLADLHDGLDSIDIPTPQDTSMILGVPLDPGENAEGLTKTIESICYSVDQLLEGFVQLDTSSLESFNSGLEELAEQAKSIDAEVKTLSNPEEIPDEETMPNSPVPANPKKPQTPPASPQASPKAKPKVPQEV